MNFDIRRYLRDDTHSWAVFRTKDIRGTMTDDIILKRKPRPVVSGLTFEQAMKRARMLNIKKFEESKGR